ncbi:MAG: hypothetical protein R3B72_09330 [Polyangiaceae bacterium]
MSPRGERWSGDVEVRPPRITEPRVLIASQSRTELDVEDVIDCGPPEAIPPSGYELEIRVAEDELRSVVTRASPELPSRFLACTARRAKWSPRGDHRVVVTVFPGDLPERRLPAPIDAEREPTILVTVTRADAPFTSASATRLLQHQASQLRACGERFVAGVADLRPFVLDEGVRQASITVALTLSATGATTRVDAEPSRREASPLAECVQRLHYAIDSTIVGSGPVTLEAHYLFRW